MTATLIVNYQHEADKTKFQDENKTELGNFRIIYVNDRNVNGTRVDLLPEF
jgi:hypothetical protein